MTPAPKRPLRVALIDLDGTLMHTAPDLALAANRVRGELGLPELHEERIAQFVGKGTDILVHRALTDDMEGRVGEDAFSAPGPRSRTIIVRCLARSHAFLSASRWP